MSALAPITRRVRRRSKGTEAVHDFSGLDSGGPAVLGPGGPLDR